MFKLQLRLVAAALFTCLALVTPYAFADDIGDLFFTSTDGARIRYVVQGAGEPVVLVHGFTANVEFNWEMPGILDGLAREFMVIAIDNRGHGKSDKPHDPAKYGDQMARDVIALLDHLKIDKAHVGGYSMGGFITMKLLTMAPDRLRSAVIGGAGWSRDTDDRTLMTALAESLERGEGIRPLISALQPAGQPAPPPEQIEMMNQMVIQNNDQAALAAAIRGMGNLSVTEAQLRANTVPAIAIVGSLDPLKAGVDAMAPIMNKLEVKVIDGADHMTAITPGAYSVPFLDAMREFLVKTCGCA